MVTIANQNWILKTDLKTRDQNVSEHWYLAGYTITAKKGDFLAALLSALCQLKFYFFVNYKCTH